MEHIVIVVCDLDHGLGDDGGLGDLHDYLVNLFLIVGNLDDGLGDLCCGSGLFGRDLGDGFDLLLLDRSLDNGLGDRLGLLPDDLVGSLGAHELVHEVAHGLGGCLLLLLGLLGLDLGLLDGSLGGSGLGELHGSDLLGLLGLDGLLDNLLLGDLGLGLLRLGSGLLVLGLGFVLLLSPGALDDLADLLDGLALDQTGDDGADQKPDGESKEKSENEGGVVVPYEEHPAHDDIDGREDRGHVHGPVDAGHPEGEHVQDETQTCQETRGAHDGLGGSAREFDCYEQDSCYY